MPKRRKLQFAAVISAAVLVLSIIFALSFRSYIPGEIVIVQAVYALGDNLLTPMLIITQFGSPFVLLGLAISLAIVHRYRFGVRLVVAGGITYVLITLLKLFISRQRPFLAIDDIISRELSISGNGFPSGHSAIIACIVLSLWFMVGKQARIGLVCLGILVGVSRIYLGVHSPLDVVGGYAAGLLIASLVQLVPSVLRGVRSS